MRLDRIRFAAAAFLLVGTSGTASSDPPEYEGRILTDTWYVSAGGSLATFGTEVSIGFGTVVGSFIRIEDDLNLDDDQKSFRLNGRYAFNPRHAIDLTVTDFSRDGETMIDEEIVIGEEGDEVVFEIGANVATSLDSRNLKVIYEHSFVNTGRTQAGIGAGLSFFGYKFSLDGIARVNDGENELTRVDEDIIAPIPSYVMFLHHAITPKLIFRTTGGYFNLRVDDYDGRLFETRFTLDYFITRQFALGGGVEGSDLEFRIHGDDPLTVQADTQSLIFYVARVF